MLPKMLGSGACHVDNFTIVYLPLTDASNTHKHGHVFTHPSEIHTYIGHTNSRIIILGTYNPCIQSTRLHQEHNISNCVFSNSFKLFYDILIPYFVHLGNKWITFCKGKNMLTYEKDIFSFFNLLLGSLFYSVCHFTATIWTRDLPIVNPYIY